MFTIEQSKAVRHDGGAALVLACPGSGKTKVITGRVRFLQKEKGVPPDKILVVTFAKDAALQMKKRYLDLTGDLTTGVTFSTIHSLCYTILNKSFLFPDRRLISDNEKKEIFGNILRKYKSEINPEEHKTLAGMRGISMDISRCKCAMSDKNDTSLYKPRDTDEETFRYFYGHYSEALLKRGLYDFDDMTWMAMEVLKKDKNASVKALQKRFSHIMIDEFQDTSAAQFDLLKNLSENIFAVGDDDQSIYSFRGASPEIINMFLGSFRDHSIYRLPDNFRSTGEIVNASYDVIKENKNRQKKEFIPKSGRISPETESFRLEGFNSHYDEAAGIVDFLDKTSFGRKKTFAVLTRTNEEALFLAAFLQKNGKKFNMRGCRGSIFDHHSVGVFLSYLRVAAGAGCPGDYVNVFRNPGSIFPSSLFYGVKESRDCMDRAERFAAEDEGLKQQVRILKEKLGLMKDMTPYAAVGFAKKAFSLDKWFMKQFEKAVVYKERMQEFTELLKGFSSIEAFLSYEKEYRSRESQKTDAASCRSGAGNEKKEMITIMTMHASKGLEFDGVWIPGANEGNLPFSTALKTDDAMDIEEERRLFYVAMTRACEVLRISFRRTGAAGRGVPSRFLKTFL